MDYVLVRYHETVVDYVLVARPIRSHHRYARQKAGLAVGGDRAPELAPGALVEGDDGRAVAAADLVGASAGGGIAQELALHNPDRVRSLVLISTSPVVSVDRELPLTTIAAYKSIIWSAYSDVDMRLVGELPLLYTYIQYRSARPPSNTQGACSPTGGVSGKVLPNYISLAMQAGVHVLITGTHPAQNALSRINSPAVKWPAIPLYEFERGSVQTGASPRDIEDPPGGHAFAYRDLCLEAIDFGYQSNGRIRSVRSSSFRDEKVSSSRSLVVRFCLRDSNFAFSSERSLCCLCSISRIFSQATSFLTNPSRCFSSMIC